MWAKNEVIKLQAAKLTLMHQQQLTNNVGAANAAGSGAGGNIAPAYGHGWPPPLPPTLSGGVAVAGACAGALNPAPYNHHMYGVGGTGDVPPPPAVTSVADDVIQRARVVLSQGFHLGL